MLSFEQVGEIYPFFYVQNVKYSLQYVKNFEVTLQIFIHIHMYSFIHIHMYGDH